MKILLTGGSSYLGGHLKDYFKSYELLTPTHEELDLTNQELVQEYILFNLPDVILHAAHAGRYNEYTPDAVEINLRMQLNLLRMQDFYKRLIYFGSGAAYNKERSLNMIDEESIGESLPQDQYGLSKFLITAGFKELKNTTVLQLFGVYGENEGNRFPTYCIKQAMLDEPIIIERNAWFEYIYVGDLCRIVEKLIKKKASLLNIGTGTPVELLTIAKKVVKLIKSKSMIIVKEEGLASGYTCSTERLNKLLPDFTFTLIDEGLEKLWEYYKMEGKN